MVGGREVEFNACETSQVRDYFFSLGLLGQSVKTAARSGNRPKELNETC